MTFPKVRVVVAAGLFLAWLGFLGFLVYDRDAIILSGPQFAVAQAIVIAEVKANDPNVVVQEVVWCADAADRQRLKTGLVLPELLSFDKRTGFHGPGVYVIPLVSKNTYYQIAPVRTPGYSRLASHGFITLIDAGRTPEPVLAEVIEYARQKPIHSRGLLDPLQIPIIECIASRSLLPSIEPAVPITLVELPRRLPISDARQLESDLKKRGARVHLHEEELRIYPATPQVRSQMEGFVAAKSR